MTRSPAVPARRAGAAGRLRPRVLGAALCFGVLGLGLGGCASSWSKTAAQSELDFQGHMTAAVTAVRAAGGEPTNERALDELANAKQHLASADAYAQTPEQQADVESLLRLIQGAEAMMAGDGAAANTQWGLIPDEDFRIEVKDKARQAGLHVPTNR